MIDPQTAVAAATAAATVSKGIFDTVKKALCPKGQVPVQQAAAAIGPATEPPFPTGIVLALGGAALVGGYILLRKGRKGR